MLDKKNCVNNKNTHIKIIKKYNIINKLKLFLNMPLLHPQLKCLHLSASISFNRITHKARLQK